MIAFVFTIDYEIFGSGEGSLEELIYSPARQLKTLFDSWNERFVVFVEVAELEMIEGRNADVAIDRIKQQIRDFYMGGYEIGLHIHPQWYNARYKNGKWLLDYREYNLCKQPRQRISQIIDRAIDYARTLLDKPDYSPFSFRAGNWLIQPTRDLASVLIERGIKVDSSVYKGGIQHQFNLDFRPALKNGYYWSFTDDANVSLPKGKLAEFPIYTSMVPIWRFLTSKRMKLQRKVPSIPQSSSEKFYRLLDFLRFFHPLKLDFCRLGKEELTRLLDEEIKRDLENPAIFRPIIAIGHTKDLFDFEAIEVLLDYLKKNEIKISNLADVYRQSQISIQIPEKGPS
jgi:hypothetical protein